MAAASSSPPKVPLAEIVPCAGVTTQPNRKHVPVHFAIVSPLPGAHAELITLLQMIVVNPLVERDLLLEFKVVSATPPSFVAESSTLIVFEFLVPCPWPVTERDFNMWQRRMGNEVKLVFAPAQAPATGRIGDAWDSGRAQSALARAMVLPPRGHPSVNVPKSSISASWITSCARAEKDDGDMFQNSGDEDLQIQLTVFHAEFGRNILITEGTTLLRHAAAVELAKQLPISLRWRNVWRLAYSPRIHGVSLHTFLRIMEKEGPSIMIIQDHSGCVFGAFASAGWHRADRYFGGGESFVFKFQRTLPKLVLPLSEQVRLAGRGDANETNRTGAGPDIAEDEDLALETWRRAVRVLNDWQTKARASAARGEREAVASGCVTSPTEALDEILRNSETGGASQPVSVETVADMNQEYGEDYDADILDDSDFGFQVYHSTATDPFYQFCDTECVAMGGGFSFALYLEKDLLHGMSEASSTFGSDQLASSQDFIISDMECWVFDDPTQAFAA